ncbi:sulfotransferase family protein [Salinibacter ruber]|uniref:Sulfotransferase family protein n=1 Tax=Salinibacter ruber TaxID=146919 RepID=A0A9X2ZTK5_9BACT|nr:hypothetical protein [Salinibacter ruber]
MNLFHRFKRLLARLGRQLPAPFHRLPEEWKQSYLRDEVKQRYVGTSVSKVKPQPKVFGIGLSKTGTSSLNEALVRLGYDSLHWTHRGQRVLGWPEFFYAEAATDTPCSAQFEALYHTFEHSKFIYTVRDIENWKASIREHFGMGSPREFRELWTEKRFWEGNFGWRWYNSLRWTQIHECLYAQHDTWETAYQAFDKRVRRFFEDKPSRRFLVMNIPGGDGWDKLCPFLSQDVPNEPFPHGGKTKGVIETNKVKQYKGEG